MEPRSVLSYRLYTGLFFIIFSKRERQNFMYKILVADDEQKIREVIREYAEFLKGKKQYEH